MGNRIDIPIGQRFGKLTVLGECGRSPSGDMLWQCRCDCGAVVSVKGFALRRGDNTSCGKCPPNNVYRIQDDVAYVSVLCGAEFIIDAEDVPKVSKYQWHLQKLNYVASCNASPNTLLHRLVLGIVGGSDVDHINGNPLDNRKCNLRACSHRQNMWNMKKPITNTTGYKGVCKPKRTGRFVAGIRVNGRQTHLGCFDTAEDAAIAYDVAALFYRGEYARTNFPRTMYIREYATTDRLPAPHHLVGFTNLCIGGDHESEHARAGESLHAANITV